MTLQLNKPDGQGALVPRADSPEDWRTQLKSSRWNLARVANPEMNPTRPAVAVLFWVALAALTFVLLALGLGTGFWHLG
jgi:hypothetical protein